MDNDQSYLRIFLFFIDIALVRIPDNQAFKPTPTLGIIHVNDDVPNSKLFGKFLKVSGWGETEKNKEPDQQFQLLWTHQRIFQVKQNLGAPNFHFLGDQVKKNGPRNSDSGGENQFKIL